MAGNSGDHFTVERFVSIEKQRNPVGFRFHALPPDRSDFGKSTARGCAYIDSKSIVVSCESIFYFVLFPGLTGPDGMFSKQRSRQRGHQAESWPAGGMTKWLDSSGSRHAALVASAWLDGMGTGHAQSWDGSS
jgi:hypothetical protein